MDAKTAFAYAVKMTCAKVSGGLIKSDEDIDETLKSEFSRFFSVDPDTLVEARPLPPDIEDML